MTPPNPPEHHPKGRYFARDGMVFRSAYGFPDGVYTPPRLAENLLAIWRADAGDYARPLERDLIAAIRDAKRHPNSDFQGESVDVYA